MWDVFDEVSLHTPGQSHKWHSWLKISSNLIQAPNENSKREIASQMVLMVLVKCPKRVYNGSIWLRVKVSFRALINTVLYLWAP